ncbi:MAG: helix-turn-helix transcriptional regulator [Clostridia bacterium]|nr:helix-turn-helix transcriptional regulator [Clostridia bacterium]
MESIRNITVENIIGGRMSGSLNDVAYKKSLPCLTVGQVVHGSMGISLAGEEMVSVGEMEVFIIPAGRTHQLLHMAGKDGVFKAHWAYMDVMVDGAPMGDVLTLPTVLSRAASGQIYAAIRAICEEGILCRRYIAAYRMLDILMAHATGHAPEEADRTAIRRFVDANFGERIGAEEIAAALGCSAPAVYRYTAKYFGMSPANYINHVRLTHAAWQLEQTSAPVRQIALSVGFEDMPYFTRLFKKSFLLPPGEYRERRLAWDNGRV